jgi:hypothetical protein
VKTQYSHCKFTYFGKLSGYYPCTNNGDLKTTIGMSTLDSIIEDCPKSFDGKPYLLPYVAHDLRRMAIGLVGKHPDPSHKSHRFVKQYLLPEADKPPYSPNPATGAIYRVPIHDYLSEEKGPVYPNTDLDDVVVHFRCGDIMVKGHEKRYYSKFSQYSKLISTEAKTIGIVTQAFEVDDGEQVRRADEIGKSGRRCRVVVTGLVDHLQRHFPNATISVRNDGPNETIAMAFARMIMANQSIALTMSSFSIWPVLTSFGTGYYLSPSKNERWVRTARDMHEKDDFGFQLVNAGPQLSSITLSTMFDNDKSGKSVLEWFQDDFKKPP